ncbi:MFS transporter [Corynebacterium pseudotuberculosis]|uniref:MFS transporter n=1 Tax=Corynebacterium pseudotuberculosis TaxID=1719 RepID=UPI000655F4D1|nr:MFS transporter [Corynebacterium pseudotuberculosis]AFH90299.2 MFS transporter [Corynebacterium pseudotuberculosis 31]APB10428.1 MFS transporter [Corynebacterium pseudotuberculosis]APB12475.1 MFS transporter [Corynebacterium pseudotuberculosis]APB14523.1 MFS transporter [Corynebacterium pseudotuberculosis]APB16568.1 MFS transporter [Corynebacterium pseudotuberculosis]
MQKMMRRPIPRQTDISEQRRLATMIALALGTFGLGITEFVTMGLLNQIAADFSVSEDTAGHVIAAYALGVMIGAPLITALTGMIPRRRLLLILTFAFVAGNALTFFASSFSVLIVARVIAGLPQGAFFSVASLAVASLAPEGQRGRSLAFVGMGLPLATVLGVPAAQALGHATSWHAAYLLVTIVGVVTLGLLWFLMPHMTKMKPTSPLTELGALARGQVWASLLIGSVGFGGMFAVYTYISWTMTQQAGLQENLMWLVLMAYGIGMIAGNWLGGRLSDWSVEYGIFWALIAIVVTLAGFFFTSHNAVLATINFGLIGLSGSLLIPSLQIRLMDVAGQAQTLAAALNQSALNIANAAGAQFGGIVIAAGYGYSAPALAGAALGIAAIILWIPAHIFRMRAEQKPTASAS